jgi:uncharacterized protein YndB with AHSA1/START domain
MSYELRLEHTYDAPPEDVFDTFVDPEAQGWLHGAAQDGWIVHSTETDVRVGGSSTCVMGREGEPPDTERRFYTVVDRPNRLKFRYVMELGDSTLTAEAGLTAQTVETDMTITFEPRDGGKTLVTLVETGFDDEAMRDGFAEGWTEYLKTLASATAWRLEHLHEGTDTLKARHDS